MNTLQIVILIALAISIVAGFIMKMPKAGDRGPAKKLLGSADWLTEHTKDGETVKLTGKVRMREHGERFMSPLTENRCVVLRLRAQVRYGRDPRAKLVEDFKIMPFLIEDEEGKVLVDAQHALLDIGPETLKKGTGGPKKTKLLEELGYEGANEDASEFEETFVEVGAMVTVVGKFVKAEDKIVGDKAHPIAVRVERVRASIENEP